MFALMSDQSAAGATQPSPDREVGGKRYQGKPRRARHLTKNIPYGQPFRRREDGHRVLFANRRDVPEGAVEHLWR
jgi:guanyl-specific ribonuclease Sa